METIPKSQNHLAKLLGISGAMVSKCAARGMPTNSVESAHAWRESNLDPGRVKGTKLDNFYQPQPHQPDIPPERTMTDAPRQPKPAQATGDREESFEQARTRKTIAEADSAQLEAALQRDEYILKTEVESAMFYAGRQLRDGLQNGARRLAAELAGLGTAIECESLLDREYRLLLTEWVRALREKVRIDAAGAIQA